MKPRWCTWRNGCMQPVSQIPHEGGDRDLCFYHWKRDRSLIDDPLPRPRSGIPSSDVVTDERLDIVNAMRQLGLRS